MRRVGLGVATVADPVEHGQMCPGCLMLTMVQRAERAEATLRDWGIEPNAEVDEEFRRHITAINRAEGRSPAGGGDRG